MVGNVFQQLYTFVDTMIVGKYLGVTALAALGATEWLVFVMFGCVQGITQGFSISMAKRFGSRDEEELKKDMGGRLWDENIWKKLQFLLSVNFFKESFGALFFDAQTRIGKFAVSNAPFCDLI